MATVLEEELQHLLDSPRLPFIARRIDELLAAEDGRRQAFYAQITEGDKAEFINGQAVFPSRVRLRHNQVGKQLLILLDAYVMRHELGYVGYEKIMVSLTRNDYEPDICFFASATSERFTPDQMRFPAPDFVVEVLSPTTAAVDRGVKLDDYAAHSVTEYWIIDPDAETLEQYLLDAKGGVYGLAIKAMTGQVRSVAVPGFDIPVRAIFDPQENRGALQAILAG